MAIQLNEIRECFNDENKSRKLAYHQISADEAYARLKILRETYDDFGDSINKHVRTIPSSTREKYEMIFEMLDELIMEECYNIENGD